jgi:hypothetical protein
MDHRVRVALLLICAALAARAEDPPADATRGERPRGSAPASSRKSSEAPVHVGAMIGVVSLPRPADVEVFVRIVDLFGVGLGYSDFPAFIANPLLDLVGANSATTSATLGQFNAFDLDLRVFPFRGPFFVGASFGRQSLQGVLTERTALGPQSATLDLTTWYMTPRAGWLWWFERGLLLGFDLGIQLKLTSDQVVTLPPSATPDIQQRVRNLADLGASYPLPSLRLRIGWML